jgi:hypothetical protein
MFTDEVSAMSSIDSLKEAKRGIGVTCRCGKSARITVRGRTLCYECFDEDMGYVFDPAGYAKRRMLERIREIDRMRDASIRMLDRRSLTLIKPSVAGLSAGPAAPASLAAVFLRLSGHL